VFAFTRLLGHARVTLSLLEDPLPDPYADLRQFVAGLRSEPLDWRSKGFGALPRPLAAQDLVTDAVRLSHLGTPMMTIDAGAVQHNVAAMAAWCTHRGLGLAPHGKTTMAPALWLAQLDGGAGAVTVANAAQLRAGYAFGVRSFLVANELVGAADLRWLAGCRDDDPSLDVLCWVDSVAAVERIEAALVGHRPQRPLTVCVEVGSPGGRTGSRSPAEVVEVAERVLASPVCLLAGVSGYEGAVAGAGIDEAGLAAVEEFLRSVATAYARLADRFETPVVTVTAGGSAYFDVVARVLGPLAGAGPGDRRVQVLLRSGCYVVHDDLHYARITPGSGRGGPELRPAIHVWASVLSRPEPDLVILDAGRRDLPFDLGLPVPQRAVRRADDVRPVDLGPAELLQLNDQHAFVRVTLGSRLAVGDVVRLGLSHPCTAFDKWRTIAVVDTAAAVDPAVVDAVHTFF
jgi:D-serine deaminase-like pyridoxal phosphate-dependent protein